MKGKSLLLRDTPSKIALIHTTAQHLGITEDGVAVFPIFFGDTDSPTTFERALQDKNKKPCINLLNRITSCIFCFYIVDNKG